MIGIAYFNNKIKGTVHFYEQANKKIRIELDLSGFPKKSKHGIHIHEAGDLTDSSCMSACSHLNPYNKNHGGPKSNERHVGDLGNIESDYNGNVKYVMEDSLIKMRGFKSNIMGRTLVIHEKEDDLGNGGNPDSLVTGNSGSRIACAIIGYSKKMFC